MVLFRTKRFDLIGPKPVAPLDKRTGTSRGILLIVMFLICLPFSWAQKHNQKDLENKKKKLKEEINTINELLHDTKNNKKISMNQVAILNKKISVREELIATINSEIRLINKEVSENQVAVNSLKKTLEKLKQEWWGGRWDEPSITTFTLKKRGKKTQLDLLHERIPNTEFKDVDKGWDEYYLGPIKEYLENK